MKVKNKLQFFLHKRGFIRKDKYELLKWLICQIYKQIYIYMYTNVVHKNISSVHKAMYML